MTEAHLSEERLTELGCARGSTARNGERAHLGSCPACARKLDDELRLSAILADIELAPPTASFVAGARARYERETRTRTARRALFLLASLAAATAICVLLAWSGIDALAVDLAETVAGGAALFRALSAIGAASPVGVAIGVAAAAATIVAASGALAALIGDREKSRASRGARVKEV
jgi:predicted anti-sigma-YlaC factor YlaD